MTAPAYLHRKAGASNDNPPPKGTATGRNAASSSGVSKPKGARPQEAIVFYVAPSTLRKNAHAEKVYHLVPYCRAFRSQPAEVPATTVLSGSNWRACKHCKNDFIF